MMSYLFLPIVLFIGGVTCFEDIRTGKIRNRWILLSLAAGLVLSGVAAVFSGPVNLAQTGLNLAVSVGVAYGLWHFGFWSAGDAKLFVSFSLLIPINYYQTHSSKLFPSLDLLINMFVPAFLVMAVRMAASTRLPRKIPLPKVSVLAKSVSAKWRDLVGFFLGLWIVFLAARSVRTFLAPGLDQASVFVLALLAIQPLGRLMKNGWAMAAGGILLAAVSSYGLRQSPDRFVAETLILMRNVFGMMIVMWLGMRVIRNYSEKVDSRTVKVRDIEIGQVLTEDSLARIRKDSGGLRYSSDGLTREEMEQIKALYPHEADIRVGRAIPFAPVAFGGVLLTLALKASVVHTAFAAFRDNGLTR